MKGLVLPADWAVRSKQPNHADKLIQRTSVDAETLVHLSRLMQVANPGTLDRTDKGTPRAAPWLSFVGSALGGRELLAVSAVDWGQGSDAVGRTFSRTRLFVLPVDDIARHTLSYRAVWEALRHHELEEGADKPVQVRISPRPRTARDPYTPLGVTFQWAAAVAAAVLDRPVVVVGFRGAGPEAALDLLDAIVDLLPSGMRARLKVGSWTENSQFQADLVFGPEHVGPNPDSYWEVLWGAPEPVPAHRLSSHAALYLSHLKTLYGHCENDAGEVIGCLAAAQEQHRLSDQDGWAAGVLERMNLPLLTYKAITDAEGGLLREGAALAPRIAVPAIRDKVLLVMREHAYGTLREPWQRAFLEYVIEYPGTDTLAGLPSTWWRAATASVPNESLVASLGVAKSGVVARFLAAIETLDRQADPKTDEKADTLWPRLLELADSQSPEVIDALARAWAQWAPRYRLALPHTATRLAADDTVLREFLHNETPEDAVRLLSMMAPYLRFGAVLKPLTMVLPDYAQPLDSLQLARFCVGVEGDASLLLLLAEHTGRLDDVTAAAASGLVDIAFRLSAVGRSDALLVEIVTSDRAASATPASRAVFDLVAFLFDAVRDAAHLDRIGSVDALEYATGLAAALVGELGDHVEPRFAQWAAQVACTNRGGAPGWAETVLAELMCSRRQQTREAVANVLLVALADRRSKINRDIDDFSDGFWTLLGENAGAGGTALLRRRALKRLTDCVPRGDDDEIALICHQALKAEYDHEDVLSRLNKLPWLYDTTRVVTLLRSVDELLDSPHLRSLESAGIAYALAGNWGKETTGHFRDTLVTGLEENIRQLNDAATDAARRWDAATYNVRQQLSELEGRRAARLAEAEAAAANDRRAAENAYEQARRQATEIRDQRLRDLNVRRESQQLEIVAGFREPEADFRRQIAELAQAAEQERLESEQQVRTLQQQIDQIDELAGKLKSRPRSVPPPQTAHQVQPQRDPYEFNQHPYQPPQGVASGVDNADADVTKPIEAATENSAKPGRRFGFLPGRDSGRPQGPGSENPHPQKAGK